MSESTKKIAVIAGAGPAGLTLALELLKHTEIKPVIFEACDYIGGISRTALHNGNRIDIGGHRFFSKNDIVMNWWKALLPLQGKESKDDLAIKRAVTLEAGGPDPEISDHVMLRRTRLSRILFARKLFDYPIRLNAPTLKNLGAVRLIKIGLSYLKVKVGKKRKEDSLEDFLINRFGVELYRTFFKDYTEKVWGVPCKEISPEWGGQRIKGLSVSKTLLHAGKQILVSLKILKEEKSIDGKKVETSLIGEFLYPKLGPGALWEKAAEEILSLGGEIHLNSPVKKVRKKENKIESVSIQRDNQLEEIPCDYFFSTMPVKDLISAFTEESSVPPEVKRVAEGLKYRDFMTVGLLLDSLSIKNPAKKGTPESRLNFIADNWIYVQESDVKLGRIQIFNNWSPYLVNDPKKVWIGLEYFVNEGDHLWNLSDESFTQFALDELEKIRFAKKEAVRDSVVIRMKKAYPAYFGTYPEFSKIREFLDPIENLFLLGRNGMHRYNNMDHSMLSAMEAVKCVKAGTTDKESLWNVNAEKEYHETKS